MGRHRWITIGSLKRIRYRVVSNSGYLCDGFRVFWRGARDWCQPWEFDDWEQMEWAITRRLELAGLRAVDTVVESSGEWRDVSVLVERNGHKLRRRAHGSGRWVVWVDGLMDEWIGG